MTDGADPSRDCDWQALVADDDDDMRTLLATTLRRVGFSVLEAADGEQLMDLFSATWEGDPAQRLVVISDIGMPVKDGIQATRFLRAAAPGLPVILVTAFSDVATMRAAKDAGATSVLLKPIDRVTFLKAAMQAVEPVVRRSCEGKPL